MSVQGSVYSATKNKRQVQLHVLAVDFFGCFLSIAVSVVFSVQLSDGCFWHFMEARCRGKGAKNCFPKGKGLDLAHEASKSRRKVLIRCQIRTDACTKFQLNKQMPFQSVQAK